MLGAGEAVQPGRAGAATGGLRISSPVLVSLALLAALRRGTARPSTGIFKRPPTAPAPAATAPATVEARKPADAPTAPAEAPAALAAAPRPARPFRPTSRPQPQRPAQRLVVRAVETTWIRVQTDDGRVAEELLPPGATASGRRARFVLTVGNAGGVELELNGRRAAAAGRQARSSSDSSCPRAGS